MSEDQGAAAPDAGQDTFTATASQQEGQDTGGGQEHGSEGAAPKPGLDDRSAESLLADAVNRGDDDGKDSDDGKTGDAELKTARAELAKWKAQARKNEQRARENADKAKNYDAYTESQKTESQKLADRAAEAEQRATAAEGRYHRTLAAATYDLPVTMIDLLGDGTEEEITARAESFAAAINERAAVMAAAQAQANGQGQPRNGTTGYRPVESLRPGALPASENQPRTPEQWLRSQITKR